MQINRVPTWAIGLACLLLAGCLEDPPPKPLPTGPRKCVTTCTSAPSFEKLGELCTLRSSTCQNGIRICTYDCEVIESHQRIEKVIRTRPVGPLPSDPNDARDGGAEARPKGK